MSLSRQHIHSLSHSRGDRGAILLVVVVAMFVVAAATAGVLMVTSQAIHLNGSQQQRAIAFNLAESGAEYGYQVLRDMSTPPATLTPLDPFGGAVAVDGGTYQATIYPDASNLTVFLKKYQIVCTGTFKGATKKVELVVQQASFGRYAYFTDKETSSISGGAIWWRAGETVDGPVHSNNKDNSNFNINYNGSNAPIFKDVVTAAGNTINYTPSRPTTETTFRKIFSDGSKGYKLSVPAIELPSTTEAQKNAAWGSSAGFPNTNGVYLRASVNGGIYIRGDAAIQFTLDASGNQKILITQENNTTTITVLLGSSSTTLSGVKGTGSDGNISKLPDGVIYCTGNITSLQGEIADNTYNSSGITKRSAYTIATDVNAGKDITLTGSLYYHTKPDKTKDASDTSNLAAGTMGLVAESTIISTACPTNMRLDAVTLSGGQNTTSGSFYAQSYNSRSIGTLSLLGGIIQKDRGPVGTFNSGTGQTTSGYVKNYVYDPRLAACPPPFFPTTGQYERLSWRIRTD